MGMPAGDRKRSAPEGPTPRQHAFRRGELPAGVTRCSLDTSRNGRRCRSAGFPRIVPGPGSPFRAVFIQLVRFWIAMKCVISHTGSSRGSLVFSRSQVMENHRRRSSRHSRPRRRRAAKGDGDVGIQGSERRRSLSRMRCGTALRSLLRMCRNGELMVHLRGMRRQRPIARVPGSGLPLLAARRPESSRVELLAWPAGAAVQQSFFLQSVKHYSGRGMIFPPKP